MESSEYFVRIPIDILLDRRLSRTAVLLYGVLVEAADRCYMVTGMPIRTLAARCRCSEKSIRRAEEQLVNAGKLRITRTGRASTIEILNAGIRVTQYDVFASFVAKKKEELA